MSEWVGYHHLCPVLVLPLPHTVQDYHESVSLSPHSLCYTSVPSASVKLEPRERERERERGGGREDDMYMYINKYSQIIFLLIYF